MAARNDGGTERRNEPLGEVARDLTRDLSLLVRQGIAPALTGRLVPPLGSAVVTGGHR